MPKDVIRVHPGLRRAGSGKAVDLEPCERRSNDALLTEVHGHFRIQETSGKPRLTGVRGLSSSMVSTPFLKSSPEDVGKRGRDQDGSQNPGWPIRRLASCRIRNSACDQNLTLARVRILNISRLEVCEQVIPEAFLIDSFQEPSRNDLIVSTFSAVAGHARRDAIEFGHELLTCSPAACGVRDASCNGRLRAVIEARSVRPPDPVVLRNCDCWC
jgi:hypothetical protein